MKVPADGIFDFFFGGGEGRESVGVACQCCLVYCCLNLSVLNTFGNS